MPTLPVHWLPDLAVDGETYLWIALTLIAAYTLFALVGFGTALIAGAPLATLLPVGQVIPLLALLDFTGAASRGWHARQRIAKDELRRLIPGMLAGQWLGVQLLANLPTPLMACLLGTFVISQGWRGLLSQPASDNASPAHAWRAGLVGGVLGGLFGSGGFMYAGYLGQKLADRDAFRATQAVLIALSTLWRIGLCAASGLLSLPLLITALTLMPALWLGHRLAALIDPHLARTHLQRLLNLLLISAGSLLIWRHLSF